MAPLDLQGSAQVINIFNITQIFLNAWNLYAMIFPNLFNQPVNVWRYS
jgi:hypothetical protein